MNKRSLIGLCWALSLVATLAGAGIASADDEQKMLEVSKQQEMPVLRGDDWQTLDRESKVAFVWGVGHVVTISEHVRQRHPELRREDFTEKLAEGLKGVPMNTVVDKVDNYYKDNPEDMDLPVMRVIWSEIVKPKLHSGIAGRPLTDQNGQ